MTRWPETIKELGVQLRNLRGGAPDFMQPFSGMAQAAVVTKACGLCEQ